MSSLRIGTCSWKYPSWQGLVYSAATGIDYLAEYAQKYDTVEIDQWFWSLFSEKSVKLPESEEAASYRRAVPDHFRFTIKAPNSLTLTHFYQKEKTAPLQINPFFLSSELYQQFMTAIAPLKDVLGPVLLQFEYLNRQKMASQMYFFEQLAIFKHSLPSSALLGIETRNPQWLNAAFFAFLNKNQLLPVLLQGYWMPPIVEVYEKFRKLIRAAPTVIIRLHGPDRKSIEKETGGDWSRIVHDRSEELHTIGQICRDMVASGQQVYVNVNNHYEGSAPLTILKLRQAIDREGASPSF